VKPHLAAAVRRAQAQVAPKRMDDADEGFNPLEIAAQEFAEAKTPQARAEAALALVQLAQRKS
jgi:DNA-directed RNA polymerase subunit K/omega